ncbi:hypothetical protein O181_004394 [Austropuccinia psidii MF-1]|uniref:Uncharacterized protein n=1 Tax=Austropuccinia psidii MF-1 TaxID=1389203 RepID=A0A9Q3GET6_9BASI|nr:hypothetical protein [Austropuccinia psidii MF-1]
MILVFSLKRVSPAILGEFNKEVVHQQVPQYLPTPSPSNSEYNQTSKNETNTSDLIFVAQKPRIHPQESDFNGPQPLAKRLLRPRANITNVNQAADDDEEEGGDGGDSCEKGKETEKENQTQNKREKMKIQRITSLEELLQKLLFQLWVVFLISKEFKEIVCKEIQNW